jgi:ATP-binding cassette subfamily B protein
MPQFYDLTEGCILLDGTDIRDATLASLRRAVGVVQEDVYLFASSVAENIRYGRRGNRAGGQRARPRHGAPAGLRHGSGPAGRPALGRPKAAPGHRARFKEPAILIFDKATSALDQESERAVQAALLGLAHGRTTLVIALWLSTIRRADRILVPTEQGILEEGGHEELMVRGGVYVGLYKGGASM